MSRLTIKEICVHYEVEEHFIFELEEVGLIHIIRSEEDPYISHDELDQLERITRLNRELKVNPPGIDVILNLLDRVEAMQKEIQDLRESLDSLEGDT
ncbi:MAG: MerR family transcriptional regulator [Flavobacteriales bacterium]|nr:MerR family transcriptional regulator [Flavobacteriales bacterium]